MYFVAIAQRSFVVDVSKAFLNFRLVGSFTSVPACGTVRVERLEVAVDASQLPGGMAFDLASHLKLTA